MIAYPSKPHFFYIKVGCKGLFITRTCYPDGYDIFPQIPSFFMSPVTYFDNMYNNPTQPKGEAGCKSREIVHRGVTSTFPEMTSPHSVSFSGPEHSHYLQQLDISNNKIKFLHQDVLQNLRYLYKIDLSNNQLYEMFSGIKIAEIMRKHDQYLELYEMFFQPPKLNASALFQNTAFFNVVDISSNNLSGIPYDLFASNAELKEIKVSNNELSKVNFKMSHLHNLTKLDIRFNKIRYLDTDSRDILDSLNEIQNSRHGHIRNDSKLQILMEGNPFVCSCEAQAFLQWFATAQYFSDTHTYQCELNGHVFKLDSGAAANAAKDDCKRYERRLRMILLSTILPLIGILAVAVSTFVIWRRCRRKIQQTYMTEYGLFRMMTWGLSFRCFYHFVAQTERLL